MKINRHVSKVIKLTGLYAGRLAKFLGPLPCHLRGFMYMRMKR
jgi:hypothetical protein